MEGTSLNLAELKADIDCPLESGRVLSPSSENGQHFRRHQRLLTASDYDRVFKKATRSVQNHFVILSNCNQGKSARLGLVVGKKAISRAVDRNRMRRIAREMFRQHQVILTGLDVVVLVRKKPGEKRECDLVTCFERHIIRVRHQCKKI